MGDALAKNKKSRFRRILTALDLPEEVDLSMPKLTMLGNNELLIENHRGILQYSEAQIRLMTTEGVIRVTGETLCIREFSAESMSVLGHVFGWQYEAHS